MSTTQMASQSVQPFLQGSIPWQRERPTDQHTDHATRSNNTLHLASAVMRPNNNNQNGINGVVIMACHCESSPGLFDECQVAANPQTKSTNLGCEWANRLLPPTSIIPICYYSAWADNYFTVPQRMEGWVDLGTAVRMCSLWQSCISQWLPMLRFEPEICNTAVRHVTTRPVRPPLWCSHYITPT